MSLTLNQLVTTEWVPGQPLHGDNWTKFAADMSGRIYMFNLVKITPGCCGMLKAIRYIMATLKAAAKADGKMYLQSNAAFNFFGDNYDMVAFVEYPDARHFIDFVCSATFNAKTFLRHAAFSSQTFGPLPVQTWAASPNAPISAEDVQRSRSNFWSKDRVVTAFHSPDLRDQATSFLTKFKPGAQILAVTLLQEDHPTNRVIATEFGERLLYDAPALVGALSGASFSRVILTSFPDKHGVLSFVESNQDAIWIKTTYFFTLKKWAGAS